LYREMQSFEKQYLMTRQRPYIQSTFNVAGKLRESIDNAGGLDDVQKRQATAYLNRYLTRANDILPLDVEIHSKFKEFDLHAKAVAPIIKKLVNLADLEIQRARQQIEKTSRLAIIVLITAFLTAVILAVIIALVFNKSITQNVVRLTATAGELRDGNLEARADVQSADELGQLADSFNTMAQRIKALVGDLEGQAATASSRLFQALESITEGFCLYDAEGLFVLANSMYREMFSEIDSYLRPGVPMKEVLRTAAEKGVFPEAAGRVDEWVREQISRYSRSTMSYEQRVGDGRWLRISQYRTQHGETVGIYTDITVRKKAEEDLLKAKDAAEAANRAKSTFLANMSHELRTPLNAILGFAQIMDRSRTIAPQDQENLAIISRSGEHLLSLINQVLDLSKIEAGRITLDETDFDFFRFLDELQDMFDLRAKHNRLQLVFERAADIPNYIRTDEVKLRQVLINLLNNAIKFTKEGGVTLRIRIGDWGLGIEGKDIESDMQSEIQNPKSKICFEVEDTGPGIAPEEMEKLFEAFAQTETGRKAQEGTGLGLPISRKFVQLMGGDIKVASKSGQGAAFTFDLNVKIADLADVETTPVSCRVVALEPGQPRYRILIVDDKPDNRKVLVSLLALFGFDIREADNGQKAIEICRTFEPHLIWMDMRMPLMDGYEVTRRIRAGARGSATVIIALTASSLEEEHAVALEAGCDDFLRKPFREADLFTLMHKHLGVRFVIEEGDLPGPEGEKKEMEDMLTPETLAALPDELRIGLEQAVASIDFDRAMEIIARIRQQNEPLAAALAEIVGSYRFDTLQVLFDKI
jgi:signal transduction histidine kinase/HAMP domain-containing protein/response regulator of citrate/malate metabolism